MLQNIFMLNPARIAVWFRLVYLETSKEIQEHFGWVIVGDTPRMKKKEPHYPFILYQA